MQGSRPISGLRPAAPADARAADLLEDIRATPTAHEAGRRIFVNRNLRFADITWMGFDMDYTLAPYAKRELEELSFEMTKARMVEALGYPESILGLPYDPQLTTRGLAIDKRLGNILKVDRHGYVGRAYHGRRPLDRTERHEIYRNTKIRLSAERYHWVDTLFALPEAALLAEIIDHYEVERGIQKVAYWKLFDDIRTSIDDCHRDGSLKAVLRAELDKYLHKDPELPHALHKLRVGGKKLFVLTNSEYEYTEAVMSHLLDGAIEEYPSWRDYFQFVVVEAQKPGFFTENRPFHEVDRATGEVLEVRATEIRDGGIYRGGSTREIALRRPDLRGEDVLYVGDHIYGDIIRSKRDTLWRTALVLEELEEELSTELRLGGARAQLDEIESEMALIQDQVSALEGELAELEREGTAESRASVEAMLEDKRAALADLDRRHGHVEARIERSFNPHWGSVFREGDEQSRFGRQVEEYACIYTSRVSNFLGYSGRQYFRTPRHWMPHEKT